VSVEADGPEGEVVVRELRTWQGTRERKVDLVEVEATIAALAKRYHAAAVILDPHQAVLMAQRLRAEHMLNVLEYAFTERSREELFNRLFDLVRRGKLKSLPHQELRRELLGLETRQASKGYRVDHRRGKHDDHAVAVALGAMRVVEFVANRELRKRLTAADTMEEQAKARIERQVAEAKVAVLARWGDTQTTRAKIEAIEQAFPTSPDDVRRHLVAYAEADSMRERLQRAYGLKGRGEFSDRMESDEEWDSRPE
jgi:hypothetical protein